MARGIIKQIVSETGTGLIRETGCEKDIFFHSTALIQGTFDRLTEGQSVDFDHKSYSKGSDQTRAINVRPAEAVSSMRPKQQRT
jgi:cold shock CspA family protein